MTNNTITTAVRASAEARTAEVPRPSRPPRSRGPLHRLRRWWIMGGFSTLMIAVPMIFIFGYFAWWPIISGLTMAFQRPDFLGPDEFVGWSNFEYVLTDPLLPKVIGNTLMFAGLSILFGFPLPLLMATFMAELRGSRRLYSVLAYLPVLIPPVVVVLLWQFFYNPGASGFFNEILGVFGIGPFGWLNSSDMVIPSMVLAATWAGAGSAMIIYLAAMTSVSRDLYEAAELDGAGIVSRTWHITFPQIRGVILILLLLSIIGSMQVFTEPFIFTKGGPDNASMTILLMIYNYAFIGADFGAATALSVLLGLVLCVVSVIYFYATRRYSK
ncbi:MAG: sugar ABC transporter permease [Microcella sp.]|uniref:carbohydrate ABC transporter permease n=1 Tax=Microcella sp. TaxID=1913979 RepID=UPI0024C664C8|nr:sugar ABC transporter permease [Microcella sp.]UYN84469.1 MAG: sugar ABC transporter permease [Microcella sp.]